MKKPVWQNKNLILGRIKENTERVFTFNVEEGDTKSIKNVKPGCGGCTTIKSVGENAILVSFKPGSFPFHLKQEGKTAYKTSKSITVYYKDDTTETLTFHSDVFR